MKCSLIVFSPTGGVQKVADILCSSIASSVDVYDLTKNDFKAVDLVASEDDIAVIALPSYGGRVPALATSRLKLIRSDGMRCVIVCVYGNRAYDDTLVEMQDLAKECGFCVISAVSAVAEHSIVHKYATNRPDATDEKELREIGARILEKLSKNDCDNNFTVPGNRPYKKAGGAGLVPKATSACVECGLCAIECPAGAIDKTRLKVADRSKCISCMRCAMRCPNDARKPNGAMVTIAGIAIKKACSVRKSCECYL